MGEKREPTGTSALPGGVAREVVSRDGAPVGAARSVVPRDGAPRGGPQASPVTRIKTVLQLRLKYLALPTAHNHQHPLICRLIVLKHIAPAPPTADLRPRTGPPGPVQQQALACREMDVRCAGLGIRLENIEPADGESVSRRGRRRSQGGVAREVVPRDGASQGAGLRPPVTRIKTVLQLRLKYLALPTAHNHQQQHSFICRLIVLKHIALLHPQRPLTSHGATRPRAAARPGVLRTSDLARGPQPHAPQHAKPCRAALRLAAFHFRVSNHDFADRKANGMQEPCEPRLNGSTSCTKSVDTPAFMNHW